MRVLAEGVETREQAAWLREHGCDLAQGFLFSDALPGKETMGYLRAAAEGDRGGALRRS